VSNPGTWLDDPANQEVLSVNRLANRCFGPEEPAPLDEWGLSLEEGRTNILMMRACARSRVTHSAPAVASGPVEAALRVLNVRSAQYITQFIDDRLEHFKQSELDVLVRQRVEAVLAERAAEMLQAEDVLNRAIGRLKEKFTADGIDEVSEEEEIQLWKLIDPSVYEEGEE
jgi:hypothetical protein